MLLSSLPSSPSGPKSSRYYPLHQDRVEREVKGDSTSLFPSREYLTFHFLILSSSSFLCVYFLLFILSDLSLDMGWSGNLWRSRYSCNCSTVGGRGSSYVPISHWHSRAWQRVSLSLSTYVSLYLLFMSLHLFIPLPTSLCLSLLLPLWILFCCYFDITKRYQDIHRDTPPLFAELSHEVPMYQLAINFPLCDCTVEPWNGPVEIAKGTHIHSFSFISFHPSSLSLSCLPHCFPSPFFVATRWFLPHFISFLILVF